MHIFIRILSFLFPLQTVLTAQNAHYQQINLFVNANDVLTKKLYLICIRVVSEALQPGFDVLRP